jgi:hypothetical protein
LWGRNNKYIVSRTLCGPWAVKRFDWICGVEVSEPRSEEQYVSVGPSGASKIGAVYVNTGIELKKRSNQLCDVIQKYFRICFFGAAAYVI